MSWNRTTTSIKNQTIECASDTITFQIREREWTEGQYQINFQVMKVTLLWFKDNIRVCYAFDPWCFLFVNNYFSDVTMLRESETGCAIFLCFWSEGIQKCFFKAKSSKQQSCHIAAEVDVRFKLLQTNRSEMSKFNGSLRPDGSLGHCQWTVKVIYNSRAAKRAYCRMRTQHPPESLREDIKKLNQQSVGGRSVQDVPYERQPLAPVTLACFWQETRFSVAVLAIM